MALVNDKERQAERIAHFLDDVLRLPGMKTRMGADPLIGLIPVIGDAVVTVWGAAILVIARQLGVPWSALTAMAYNQLKNGLIGAVPFVGDAYSFYFKSNALNAALLLRTVKRGEDGACRLTSRPLTFQDVMGLTLLILPIVALVSLVSIWFWEHDISYLSLFFPAPYQSR